ncbi:hypothetical protein OKA05_16585 [Luteolibacter arcticus]|uniref:Uncharacterized protein n=1 Tax=Luteolibacter arcticus TaxID=1581411 RepID=A0ABT3GL28_9BACT|nr:hypothetical protein [Luteolibacter arcticus]MCW1924185.1 hypothetical protein [Luteolibacter arcticus]
MGVDPQRDDAVPDAVRSSALPPRLLESICQIAGVDILGSLKGEIIFADDNLDQPTTSDSDWKPSL